MEEADILADSQSGSRPSTQQDFSRPVIEIETDLADCELLQACFQTVGLPSESERVRECIRRLETLWSNKN
jgi:hypothetical protein